MLKRQRVLKQVSTQTTVQQASIYAFEKELAFLLMSPFQVTHWLSSGTPSVNCKRLKINGDFPTLLVGISLHKSIFAKIIRRVIIKTQPLGLRFPLASKKVHHSTHKPVCLMRNAVADF